MSSFLGRLTKLFQSSKRTQVNMLMISIFLLIILAFRIAEPWEISCVIILCIICIINGIPFVRRYFLYPYRNSTALGLLSFSFFIGFAISMFIISCLLLICGWNLIIIFSCLLIMNGLIIWESSKSFKLYRVNNPLWDDLIPYFLILVILSVFLPLWNVGELTPKGYAFPSLFGCDLLYRIGYTAHVAHGLSNESIFFTGQKIPYYYIFYVFPAIIYKLAGRGAHLLNIFRVLDVILAAFFLICLFEFFRCIHLSRIQKVFIGVLGFISYSFKPIVCLLIQLIRSTVPLFGKIFFQHIDYQIVSHGWLRDFLVEPHSLCVISLFIVCFIILGDLSIKERLFERIIISGLLLYICFGIDSFLGALLVVWYGLCLIGGVIFYPESRKYIIKGLLVSGIIGLSVLVLFGAMGIVDPSCSMGRVLFAPHKKFIATLPLFLFIEYGLMGIIFLPGIWQVIREKKIFNWPWFQTILAIIICLFFTLMIQHPLEIDVVQRKSGKIMQVGLLLFSAMALKWASSLQKNKKFNIITAIVLILIFVGSSSLFIDIFILSNNRSGYCSSFIYPEDYDAVRWVIENTPDESIVQSLPMYFCPELTQSKDHRENYTISLFSQIGERKMALGDFKFAHFSQTTEDTVSKRAKDIYRMFQTIFPEEAWEIAYKYNIDYIYIGKYEILKYSQAKAMLRSNKDLFKEAYNVNEVSIFKVLKRGWSCLEKMNEYSTQRGFILDPFLDRLSSKAK